MPSWQSFAFGNHTLALDVAPLRAWQSLGAWTLAPLALVLACWLTLLAMPGRRSLRAVALVASLALAWRSRLAAPSPDLERVAVALELSAGSLLFPLTVALGAGALLVLLGSALAGARRGPLAFSFAFLVGAGASVLPLRARAVALLRWRAELARAPRLPELRFAASSYRVHVGRALALRPASLTVLGTGRGFLGLGGETEPLPAADARAWGLVGPSGSRALDFGTPRAPGRGQAETELRWGPLRVRCAVEYESVEERGDPRLPFAPGYARSWLTRDRGGAPQRTSYTTRLAVESSAVVEGLYRHRLSLRIAHILDRFDAVAVGGRWEVLGRPELVLLVGEASGSECSVPGLAQRCYCAREGPLAGPLYCVSSLERSRAQDVAIVSGPRGLAALQRGLRELATGAPANTSGEPALAELLLTEADGVAVTSEALRAALPGELTH